MNAQTFMEELGKVPFEAFDEERPLSSTELQTRWKDQKNMGGPLTNTKLEYPGPSS